MEKNKGLLIAFEGIDGSGLTTHSKLLVRRLQESNYPSIYTKEPTTGPIGALIREFLKENDPENSLLALLFAADRVWHYYNDPSLPGRGIHGAISNGYIVVTDRYKYSSIAYQGAFTDIDWVWSINSHVPEASIIIYLDVDIDIALSRVSSRDKRETYETSERLLKIKNNFEKVLRKAEEKGTIVLRIRGSIEGRARDLEDVAEEIYDRVLDTLHELH